MKIIPYKHLPTEVLCVVSLHASQLCKEKCLTTEILGGALLPMVHLELGYILLEGISIKFLPSGSFKEEEEKIKKRGERVANWGRLYSWFAVMIIFGGVGGGNRIWKFCCCQ